MAVLPVVLLFCFNVHGGNEPEWVLKTDFTPTNVNFTGDDSFVVLENSENYEVWSTIERKKVLSGKYRTKLSPRIPGVYLKEGSASLLFPEEEVFIQIDYTLNNTEAVAFDLKTSEEIWAISNLDMGVSTAEAIYSFFDNAQRVVNNNDAMVATAISVSSEKDAIKHKRGVDLGLSYIVNDETVSKLINYLPERNAIAINGKNALQLLDLKSGEILWTQPELRGGLGEVFYAPESDVLIAVRVNNQLKNIVAKPEIQALNAETGDVIWTVQYNGNFTPGISYVVGETLVLPFYGLLLIDVKTGMVREGDAFEAMKRSQRMLRNSSVLMGGDTEGYGENCSHPYLDENDVLHYVAGYRGKKHMDPDGGKKAYFQVDIHNDKFLLVEPDIAKGGNANRIVQEEIVDDIMYLKTTKGFTNSYILAIDTKSGKVLFETKPVSNRLDTEFDPFQVSKNQIIDASSKGIHFIDAKTGKELAVVSYKDTGVGKFRNQLFFDKGLILMGTEGLAVTNNKGEVKAAFDDFGKIKDLYIGDEIYLVEKNRLTRLGIEPIEVIEQTKLDKNEGVFFSPSGRYMVRADGSGRQLSMFAM